MDLLKSRRRRLDHPRPQRRGPARPRAKRAVALAVLALAACTGAPREFRCERPDDCGPSPANRCEANGRCSTLDSACPPYSRRYVDSYAGELSGTCVAWDSPSWVQVVGGTAEIRGAGLTVAADATMIYGYGAIVGPISTPFVDDTLNHTDDVLFALRRQDGAVSWTQKISSDFDDEAGGVTVAGAQVHVAGKAAGAVPPPLSAGAMHAYFDAATGRAAASGAIALDTSAVPPNPKALAVANTYVAGVWRGAIKFGPFSLDYQPTGVGASVWIANTSGNTWTAVTSIRGDAVGIVTLQAIKERNGELAVVGNAKGTITVGSNAFPPFPDRLFGYIVTYPSAALTSPKLRSLTGTVYMNLEDVARVGDTWIAVGDHSGDTLATSGTATLPFPKAATRKGFLYGIDLTSWPPRTEGLGVAVRKIAAVEDQAGNDAIVVTLTGLQDPVRKLLRVTATGGTVWTRELSSTGELDVTDLTVVEDQVVVAGTFKGVLSLGGGVTRESNAVDAFIAVFSASPP